MFRSSPLTRRLLQMQPRASLDTARSKNILPARCGNQARLALKLSDIFTQEQNLHIDTTSTTGED